MENYSFFALAFRMKYINRWGLMRNITSENLLEHSAQCSMLAHALAEIGNTVFGKNYDCGKTALCALYPDMRYSREIFRRPSNILTTPYAKATNRLKRTRWRTRCQSFRKI